MKRRNLGFEEIKYLVFFYIPIILAWMLYYRKGVYIAIFLGAFHVLTTLIARYFGIVTPETRVILETLQRAAIFLFVAYVVGLVSENHAESLLREEKRRTEELRKNEEKYRPLVESTEDSVYLVDQDSKYLFMSEKHLLRLGLARGQFLGHAYGDFHSAGVDETVY